MATTRVEYRFVLDVFTPESIPMHRLAEYMADLAALYGDLGAVHFVGVEESSLAVVSAVEAEADPRVAKRLEGIQIDEGTPDAKRAFDSLDRKVAEDRGTAYVAGPGRARILTFPGARPGDVEPVFGPFWQDGALAGIVIGTLGKGDPVSVRLLDHEGHTHTCKAKLDLAKDLKTYQWESPVRLEGRGKWIRLSSGEWQLLEFNVQSFVPQDDEPLAQTILRLQAVDGRWKGRPDPVGELERIRHGDDGAE